MAFKKSWKPIRCDFIHKDKKGATLTDEGKILFEYVKKGIDSFTKGENVLTNLKNLDSGKIKIGASTTVSKHVLMPYLEKFHELYPNIDIEIVNNLTETLLTELRNGDLDMLLLNLPTQESKDLKIQKVLDVQDIFVSNKKYSDLIGKEISLEQLNEYPLLFHLISEHI